MSTSTTLEGGAFLATLKAKNEKSREVKELAKREQSMYKDRRKSSMFGSFFSSTRKSFLIPRTSSENVSGDDKNHHGAPRDHEANSKPEDVAINPEMSLDARSSLRDDAERAEVVDISVTTEVVQDSTSVTINSQSESKTLDHHVPTHSSSTPTFRRASTSMESFRRDSSTTSEHHPDHHREHGFRRMSASMESFTRRDSSTMSDNHQDNHRERSPSKANMDEVYGRTGKDPRKWEVSNPLLGAPIPERRLSLSQSASDLEIEQKKRQSLYKSAPHVDQNALLERRNTRAGRNSIVEVTPPGSGDVSADAPNHVIAEMAAE